MTALRVRANAKINLTLDVLGRRADGYHALSSVMQTIELHDTLELTVADEVTFHCDEPDLGGADNLAYRAACLLREATGYRGGASIMLHKRIPVGAGLGGGSSDAAATLRGLNELWGLRLERDALAELGARLGSDVPFFFYAPTALVSGRGEVVEPLAPLPAAHVVLLKPAGGVSTAQLFGALSPDCYGDDSGTQRLLHTVHAGLLPTSWPLSNGLQRTVEELYPNVADAIVRLRRAGAAQPVMTGSGSAVFALFDDEDAARQTYEAVDADGLFRALTRTANLDGP